LPAPCPGQANMRIFDTNIWHRIVYTLGAPTYNILTRGFRRKRRRSIELARHQPAQENGRTRRPARLRQFL